jgi:Protein of unknown function (DUF499)
MRTVRDACELQDYALDVRVSDQIEQLDELISTEEDGQSFFERTHITDGMRTLVTEGISRLAGKSTQAIFHLKQAMGGGKTHLLVGFGLLAKFPSLRTTYCAEIPYIGSFDTADIVAFNGRNNPHHFYWGEIAEQLGKPEIFQGFWASGPKAPDEKAWLKLFDSDKPILILLDELPPYFHYLDTQKVGNGTIADIATRAFANMLTAAGKKANVCVVVSDLSATYDTGMKLINKALDDARQEIGRQERNITPVDLAGNEIYDILRKRLFKSLPDAAVIGDIAAHYGRTLEEATRSRVANRGAEAIADEIANTYPFHPRLKNLVALFKENENFKQTRGLMELISRLLKSVWKRQNNDVYLIGPQHFDMAITDVREKLTEISGMRDVIAKDLWDANISAHAQLIDMQAGYDTGSQVGALLLTASLSTAVNAVKGLTKEETLECLLTPVHGAAEFNAAFEALDGSAWYLHHTPEGRYYFDRQENLTKLLQSIAHDAPEPKIDELIGTKLKEMFRPARKTVYDEVIPLPKLDEVIEKVRRNRVLLVVSPDSKIPPEEVQRFFASLAQKNNVCVLTGDKTHMGSVEKSARQLFATIKADARIRPGHPQRGELERKHETYMQDFTSTVLSLFDKILFPINRPGRSPQLVPKTLDITRDVTRPFDGEVQIERTLTSDPLKLYLDVDGNFDAIRDRAEDILWPVGQDEARWSDIVDKADEEAGMPWLPPRGLEQLKVIACNRGKWEDLGNGYITKKPKKKKTSVQVTPEREPDDTGSVRLRVMTQNAGPAPRVHYAADGPVSESSPVLGETFLETNALRVQFLVIDPSQQYETGSPVTWSNKLVIRNRLHEENGGRKVELFVAPRGTLKYSLDGSEARNGLLYDEAIAITNDEVLMRAFAEAEGLEAKIDFRFAKPGERGVRIDETKPAQLTTRGAKKLDSREKTFAGLDDAKERGITFGRVVVAVGQGNNSVTIAINDTRIAPGYIETILDAVLQRFDATTPIALTFGAAEFASGHDLKQFTDKVGIEIHQDEVTQ